MTSEFKRVEPGFYPIDPDEGARVLSTIRDALRGVRSPAQLWKTFQAFRQGKKFLWEGGPSQLRIRFRGKSGVHVFELSNDADVEAMYRNLASQVDLSVVDFIRESADILEDVDIRSFGLERLRGFEEPSDLHGIVFAQITVWARRLSIQVNQGRIPLPFAISQLDTVIRSNTAPDLPRYMRDTIGELESLKRSWESGDPRIAEFKESKKAMPSPRKRSPRWIPVVSTNLRALRYGDKSQTLWVRFMNDTVYKYMGVPKPLYRELLTASSKGSFFHRHIRTSFPFKKVGPK